MGRVSARDVNGLLSSPENACLGDKEMSLTAVEYGHGCGISI